MVERTERIFLEEEMEDYGKSFGSFPSEDGKRATRMSFQVFFENGEPIRYVAYPGGGSFTREQWLRFCDLIDEVNGMSL